jgi:prepilin-type N-terminal cleavage/methylation domain-containing protein
MFDTHHDNELDSTWKRSTPLVPIADWNDVQSQKVYHPSDSTQRPSPCASRGILPLRIEKFWGRSQKRLIGGRNAYKMKRSNKRTIERRLQRAFTLIEMLAVLAIISIIGVLLVPAFGSLSNARAVNQGVDEVSSILQMARSEAVARQSYVWVGFSQGTTSEGAPQLTMMAASSLDGSTNYAPANLTVVTRPVRVTGVVMTTWDKLKSATSSLFTEGTPTSVGGSRTETGIVFPAQAGAVTNTVTFTSRGEAMINATPTPDDPYDPYLDVSFQQANTATPKANANDASVIIDGGTGAVQTVRVK